jgi:hypothetical protein
MNKFCGTLLIALVLTCLSCQQEAQDSALDLLRQGIQNMGGEDVFSSLETIERKGRVKAYTPAGVHEGDIRIVIRKEPAGILIHQTFGGEDILQGFDGRMSWHETYYSDPVTTPEYNHFFNLFALLNLGGLSLGLKDTAVVTEGEGGGDTPAREVTVELDAAHRYRVMFNPATGLPDKMAFETKIGPEAEEISYSLSFGDYKKAENLRLPHHWTCYFDGEKIAEIEFSEIRINSPLDDALFQINHAGSGDEFTLESDLAP